MDNSPQASVDNSILYEPNGERKEGPPAGCAVCTRGRGMDPPTTSFSSSKTILCVVTWHDKFKSRGSQRAFTPAEDVVSSGSGSEPS
mmetsp:Transcript_21764/g.47361  ORF Transcript_21764/g.47361 Transcript_21764/m.47361 type:complete len:87 (+) Transcript_21764:1101-1361(+)